MVRQGVSFRIINSVRIKRTAFRISAAELAIHVSFGNYTPAEQAMAEMFSHLDNLLVFFMARYRRNAEAYSRNLSEKEIRSEIQYNGNTDCEYDEICNRQMHAP